MDRKELTVGELKKALKGVPDDIPVKLSSDTGVDQGEGRIIIESARRVNYKTQCGEVDYFDIYANDCDDEDENEED
jgi:hypothetical protein